jgi:glycosyltransferase involved in cell wall biosynthesis
MSHERKIKLIEVIADSKIGGGPKHVLGLLSHLDREKFECSLICPKGYLSSEAREISRLNVCNLRFGSKFDLVSAYLLRRLIDKIRGSSKDPFGPTIVHFHGPRAGFLGRISISKEIRSVYTEHIFDYGYKINNPLNYYFQKKLLANFNFKTDLIIAVSNSVKDYLVSNKMAPADRIVVIPNGIEKVLVKKAKEEPNTPPIIGTVGQLNKSKGYDYLIKAMPEILESIPLLTLEIIGEGAERTDLESLINKLNLKKHVTLLGKKSDIVNHLKNWDVFVAPSISETFGIAALEAMSAGLPVIASNVGGLPDIIENDHSGLLIPTGKPDQIANTLVELLTNKKEYKKLAHNGFLRSKEFLWDKIIKIYEDVFEQLVSN